MFPRLLVSIIPAGLVTLGLFAAMITFISTANNELKDDSERYMLDFVRLEQEETVQTRERKPEKPPEPEQTPPEPVTPRFESPRMDEAPPDLSGPPLAMESGLDISTGFGLSASDGDYLPIVKVQPVYPRRALSRGIEGYVLLEFTVTRTGAVRDPVIIESEPPNVFDDAAVRAALKFKYKPKVVNGEAVDVAGVQNRITFRLEK
ncbi:protein TonB [Marinobacter sp. EhC06]|jgi:protein TonB|uniref:energy transducer TonB n=1 Tax=Marinobacter TaxID=2742 RepID=UPI0007D97196|nr:MULTISPECIES: energy transducer TonB [unclassified Marinobacter]OAN88008.1 protein TonB [Marinobacter sp. EhN04]OAN90992.1 protein TonB [Marinobacter sp. EhC06]